MDKATRLSWLSPALEKAMILGKSPAGMLSMQKKPISSSAFMATDFPAPESPLTMRRSIVIPLSVMPLRPESLFQGHSLFSL